MKLFNILKKEFSLIFILLLIVLSLASSLTLNRLRNKKTLNKDFNSKGNNQSLKEELIPSLPESILKEINSVYSLKSFEEIQGALRYPEYHLKDIQIRDIYEHMSSSHDGKVTKEDLQSFYDIFVSNFEKCDNKKKDLINLDSFRQCFNDDIYLNEIQLVKQNLGYPENFTKPGKEGVADVLFNLLDENRNDGLSFYDYFNLRVIRYGWMKCSPNKATIEEANFECAINIVSGFNKLEHNILKALYNLGVKFGGSTGERYLDFSTYAYLASSIRLFSLINSKRDKELTKKELINALEQDILPSRYNEKVIEDLFELTKDENSPLKGIDLVSFVFYDYYLRVFDKPIFGQEKEDIKTLNLEEFKYILTNNIFFQNEYKEAIKNIIIYKNANPNSYTMRTKNIQNSNNLFGEGDFISFLEISRKDNFKTLSDKSSVHKKGLEEFAEELFSINDSRNSKKMSFYDFGTFIQIIFIFTDLDSKYNKGKLTAQELYDGFVNYNNFPIISTKLKNSGKSFNLFSSTNYLDLLCTFIVLRNNDDAQPFLRGGMSLEEIELKNLMKKLGLIQIPDGYLNTCKRGENERNLEIFDYECAIITALKVHIDFINTQTNFMESKQNELNLTETEFTNPIDELNSGK